MIFVQDKDIYWLVYMVSKFEFEILPKLVQWRHIFVQK